MIRTFVLTSATAVAALVSSASAVVNINAAQTLRQVVNVNVVRVADDAGGNAAPTFGNATQEATIFSAVDKIWSQAGIDINFTFRTLTYNNSFALGTPGTTTVRPDGDLSTIVSTAQSAGVTDSDPTVINLFQVRVVPFFAQTSDNTANGLAFVSGNGRGLWTGPNLLTFNLGLELTAKVLAHEIGHNLGLNHLSESQNLMESPSPTVVAPNIYARLNSSQISIAKSSSLVLVQGDTDDDDDVDFDDLLTLARHYSASASGNRTVGDFDRNSVVNFDDLLTLARNYGYHLDGSDSFAGGSDETFDADWATAFAMVPEPTMLAALPVLATLLMRRRV